ncbi:MAG: hypothetical protein JSU81_04685 [Candidatus Coatesbacteria bacterium]|nr:MAG: hypothetical protein JSU81_04685 [Candidatus Coatesbacteria bacterium]
MNAARLIVAAALAGAATSVAETAFADRLAWVEEAELDEAFKSVAVKAHRPMPWSVFVDRSYRELKRDGAVTDSDLGDDAGAAVWLALLDPEYRRTGKLIYVDTDRVPGVEAGRWMSLEEFEVGIMPDVVRAPEAYDGGAREEATRALVARATALYRMAWDKLYLIPAAPAAGWRPLGPGEPEWLEVRRLEAAYAARDAASARRAAEALANALGRRPGYPSRLRLGTETYLNKFAVLKIANLLYVLSAVLFIVGAATRRRKVATGGLYVAWAAVVATAAGLAARFVITGFWPVASRYESLVLVSAAAAFFLVCWARGDRVYGGAVVMPVAALIFAAAWRFPAEVVGYLPPALHSPWYVAHSVAGNVGRGFFAVVFAGAASAWFDGGKEGGAFSARASAEAMASRAAAWAYPLFVGGALVAGAVWSQLSAGAWWTGTPAEAGVLGAALLGAAYWSVGRLSAGRSFAAVALAALTFAAALFSLFADLVQT